VFDLHLPLSLSLISFLQSPETHTRPAELEAVLSKYELPKARLAGTLPSRPIDDAFSAERDVEDDGDDDDGVIDRKVAKLQSSNKFKSEQKKAKQKDALGATI
jgi:hypothetical protein